jgi:predicted TIM-barrel fold metal-dependent hydrolase
MAWDSLEALVDVHAHFLTDRYVAAARAAGHEKPDGMPGWPAWSADEHLRLMDQWNVETAFLSISSPGVHFGDDTAARLLAQHVNDAGAGLRRDHSDRYGHFASLPLPDVEGALVELSRALDTTRAVTDLIFSGVFARHPAIRWVFTHGGGALPLLVDRLELFQAGLVGRGGATVQELVSQLWFDMAGTPFPNQVPAVARAFGTGRMLYGSDYCWTPSPGITAQVASLDTAAQPQNDTWRTLTSRNASRLFAARRI